MKRERQFTYIILGDCLSIFIQVLHLLFKTAIEYKKIENRDINPKSTIEREYTFRGECKLQLEDYRGALNDFELALKENVEQSKPNIYNFIAETKLYLKDYLGAINEVNKCIQINGGNTMHIVDGILEKNNYYLSRAYLIRGLANHLINKVESACVDWSKSGELGEAEAYIYIKKYCNNR